MTDKPKINKTVLFRLLMTIAGYGLLATGAYLIYYPAGYIVAGICLTVETWR